MEGACLIMFSTLQTRLLHWKKKWLSLVFWLLFPIIATLLVIHLTSAFQDDSKVPVGIVMEEETPLAKELNDLIKKTSLIRVYNLTEKEALHKLEKHELDSVFVVQNGYENKIRKGSRNRLITSYRSDLSFAYSPVKEMIVSYVQQDTGRAKAAFTIKQLSDTLNKDQQWTWQEIVAKSKEIEADENLLHTTFSFADVAQSSGDNEIVVWNTWGLWALFILLATLLLFDWVIKENRLSLMPRFAFNRISFKSYLLLNVGFYTILMILFDLTAFATFYLLLDESINMQLIWSILTYRIMLNAGAFLLTLCFNQIYSFYSVSFVLTLLLAITSGAVIPVEGITNKIPLLELLNPLHAFLQKDIGNLWLILFTISIIIWYARKEKSHAKRQLLN